MNRIIFGFCLLLPLTLFAEENSTYNFYFQKAPGPVTVNQGGAGQPTVTKIVEPIAVPAPAAVEQQQPEAPVKVPLSTTLRAPPLEIVTRSGPAQWAFSLGYSVPYNEGSYAYGWDGKAAMSGQMVLGLEYRLTDFWGFFGEYMYLRKPQFHYVQNFESNNYMGHGSDWSGGLAVTPLRLPIDHSVQLRASMIAGEMTVPYERAPWEYHPAPFEIQHGASLFYGGRIGLEFNQKFSAQFSLRRIDKFKISQNQIILAYLF